MLRVVKLARLVQPAGTRAETRRPARVFESRAPFHLAGGGGARAGRSTPTFVDAPTPDADDLDASPLLS